MDYNNLPSNTDSYREKAISEERPDEEDRRVTKVVSAPVTTRRLSVSKIVHGILADDIANIKDNLIDEVLIPSISDFAWNSLNNAVDVIFGGGRGRRGSSIPAARVGYSRSYDDSRNTRVSTQKQPASKLERRIQDYNGVIFATRRDAEDVVIKLEQHIRKYGVATVSTFYQLCGLEDQYTDQYYGWTDVSEAVITHVHGGYSLRLPKALTIGE